MHACVGACRSQQRMGPAAQRTHRRKQMDGVGAVPRLPSGHIADAALARSSAVAPAGALRRSVRRPMRMLPCAARRSLLQAPPAASGVRSPVPAADRARRIGRPLRAVATLGATRTQHATCSAACGGTAPQRSTPCDSVRPNYYYHVVPHAPHAAACSRRLQRRRVHVLVRERLRGNHVRHRSTKQRLGRHAARRVPQAELRVQDHIHVPSPLDECTES